MAEWGPWDTWVIIFNCTDLYIIALGDMLNIHHILTVIILAMYNLSIIPSLIYKQIIIFMYFLNSVNNINS